MKKIFALILSLLFFPLLAYGQTGIVTKGPIGEQDLSKWNGVTGTFTRGTSTGGTSTLNKIGYEVDALMVYGGGVNYTSATIQSALTAIGTVNKVTLVLRPGTWLINPNLTIPANITLKIPAGAMLFIDLNCTLTINGKLDAGLYKIFDIHIVDPLDPEEVGKTDGIVTGLKEARPEWWAVNTTPGTTDMTLAIQRALRSVYAGDTDGTNGTVFLPTTKYGISGQLVLLYGVRLIGAGARSTNIKVLSTFAELTTTGAIRLGDATASVFGTSVEHLTIDCNNIAGSIGIYSSDLQDHSGIKSVLVNNFGSYGVKLDGAPGFLASINGFVLDELECYKSASVAAGGIGLSIENGTWGAKLNRITVYGPAASPLTTGIYTNNFPPIMSNISCDGTGTNGILLHTNTAAAVITGLNSALYTNAINISNTSGVVCLFGIQRTGGTNILVDDGTGTQALTLTDTLLPMYIRGAAVIPYADRLNITRKLTTADATVSALLVTNAPISLADSATPSVAAGNSFLTGGTTTITNFTGGVPGQIIHIIGSYAVTITDGTNIFLSGSANFNLASSGVLTLIQSTDGKWYEMSRSVN